MNVVAADLQHVSAAFENLGNVAIAQSHAGLLVK